MKKVDHNPLAFEKDSEGDSLITGKTAEVGGTEKFRGK